MKFFAILALALTSLTSAQAQSLDRYDQDYIEEMKTKGRYYAEIELAIGGLLWRFAPSSATLSDKFWAKIMPTEAAKLKEAIQAEKAYKTALAEAKKIGKAVSAEDKAGLDAVKTHVAAYRAEMKAAQKAKLESWGFFKRMSNRTYGIYKWGGRILVGFLLADGTFRLYHIITDKPVQFDESAQIQQISPQQMNSFLL